MQLFGRINLISLCSMLKFWIIECGARLNPEELVTAVIDLAEYEYTAAKRMREKSYGEKAHVSLEETARACRSMYRKRTKLLVLRTYSYSQTTDTVSTVSDSVP